MFSITDLGHNKKMYNEMLIYGIKTDILILFQFSCWYVYVINFVSANLAGLYNAIFIISFSQNNYHGTFNKKNKTKSISLA